MEETPAGWRPDPFGRYQMRYWDGTDWTEHVATGGVQQKDPMGATLAIPFAIPPTATAPTDSAHQFAVAPPAATSGGPAHPIAFLDRMGPDARRRPEPEAGLALAGIGGLLLAAGVSILVIGESDPTRAKVALVGAAVFAVALVVRLALPAHRYLRAAAVGAGAVGLAELVGAAVWDSTDSGWASLLLGVAFFAAWALPGFLGRPLFLGIAVLAVVVSIGQATSDDSLAWNDEVGFTEGYVGSQGAVFLALAIVLLGLVFLLDRRGYHGVATALVVPALVSTGIGVGETLSRVSSATGTAILVVVVGLVVCLVGAYGKRRATSWLGAGVAAVGLVSLLVSIVDPESATSIAVVLLIAGALLVAAPLVVHLVRRSRQASPAATNP